MIESKKRKQMIFDISEDIHTQVKVFAAMRNITMNRWMQKAITDRLEKEMQYNEQSNMSKMQS